MGKLFSTLEKFKLIEKSNSTSSDHSPIEEAEITYTDSILAAEQYNAPEEKATPSEDDTKQFEIKEDKVNNMDKILLIDEIYNKFNMETISTSTVFIIDSFIKALPDNLPTEIKRQAVLNIITASGMNLENLLSDGKDRLNVLNNYNKDFSKHTQDTIIQYQMEIEHLNKKIEECKKHISIKDKLQHEQKALIDYETQRIDDIINFISK